MVTSSENNFEGDLIYALGYCDAMPLSVVSERISAVFTSGTETFTNKVRQVEVGEGLLGKIFQN